jgi:hypothetical protein
MFTKFILNIQQKKNTITHILILQRVSKLRPRWPEKKTKTYIFDVPLCEYRNDTKLIMFHISTTFIKELLSKESRSG